MVLTPSVMATLGSCAPTFKLPNYHVVNNLLGQGELVGLDDFKSRHGLLVMFLCNHCPYVIHINQGLVTLANHYLPLGIDFVAINPNDVATYPEDAPDKMRVVAQREGYPFPYLHDETQEVARAYDATCTPDFFLYDSKLQLYYRGRLDGSTPGNSIPVTAEEMADACDTLIRGESSTDKQRPSMGCSIKWKA